MPITSKQKYDINNMNVASQNISLGDIIDGMGGMASQSGSAVNITGGYINNVKFGSSENYASFSASGTLTFSGSATTWDDLFFPLTTGKQGNTDQPAFSTTEVGYLFPINDPTHIMYFIVQFPHNWKLGTSVHPHVHWKQTQSGSVVFKMDYKWFDIAGNVPAAFSTYIMNQPVATYTSGSIHQLSTGSALISGSHISNLSSIMLVKLYRDDSTYAGNAVTYQFDLHVEIDSLGSDGEFSK